MNSIVLLSYSTGYIIWTPLGSCSPKYEDLTLNKVVGDLVLRWNEFLAVIAIAEATLNIGLLAPVESTSDGIEPFTHGHFLFGGPLYALSSLPDEHSKITSLRTHSKTHTRTLEEMER